MVEDNQKWDKQINGKGGVIPSLNTRLYLLKRMKNKINLERLKKVADGIWSSKLRYGLQLYAKVRTNHQDPINSNMDKLQIAQNKLARVLENVKLSDRVPVKTLLEKHNLLSVNQTSAQIKLTEIWKAINMASYPIKIVKQSTIKDARTTRGVTFEKLVEQGLSSLTFNSCIGDATKLWNKAPEAVRATKTFNSARAEIRKFVLTLPM